MQQTYRQAADRQTDRQSAGWIDGQKLLRDTCSETDWHCSELNSHDTSRQVCMNNKEEMLGMCQKCFVITAAAAAAAAACIHAVLRRP